MDPLLSAALQVLILLVALAVVYRPLGDYMARTLESPRHTRVERGIYRVIGVDAGADQRWSVYLRSVLAFSVVSIVVLFAILRLQAYLPYSLGREGMPSLQALNTAVSFVTNTNWQSYSGEAALGYTAQMAGLAVQNFLSAAVGIAVAVALVRGLVRTQTDRLGNFWVDLTRITIRVLLPLAALFAIVLLINGVVQNYQNIFDTLGVSDFAILLNGAANGAMPAWKTLSDTEIAAVITYTKNSWTNKTGQLVQPAAIVAARK